MKHLFFCIMLLHFYVTTSQTSFKTGNPQFDLDLNIINTQGRSDLNSFKADMRLSYNISERKFNYMSVDLHMIPGEIYLSLEIAKIARISIDDVLLVYRSQKAKGWGFIAKELGIKPGSKEFHSLKSRASVKKGHGQSKKQKIKSHKNKGL